MLGFGACIYVHHELSVDVVFLKCMYCVDVRYRGLACDAFSCDILRNVVQSSFADCDRLLWQCLAT